MPAPASNHRQLATPPPPHRNFKVNQRSPVRIPRRTQINSKSVSTLTLAGQRFTNRFHRPPARLHLVIMMTKPSQRGETYQSRSRRETLASGGGAAPTEEEISRMAVDVAQAERKIQHEFGPKACIEEEPCRLHAVRTNRSDDYQPDWNEILKDYKVRATGMKQWYLLSVFIGDYIRDVQFLQAAGQTAGL
ncbi:conserved hypothetical protein [Culex quinquefasciatus]|uniref:Uncharacterized protein n=1 Tax=Culex quinquefasciatus TaxID=7176 RepID=B0WJM5_CULQU|nr:conserved hypothetical protein [Culex quinquefasciatus]|eukprot:XP_001848909.1 conserved hypothetical protein [Culex quinquefasciatus]